MAAADALDPAALDALLETTGGDPAFLAELIDAYVDDAKGLLAAMEDALAVGNAEEMRRAAHSLKSNSASVGALPLAGLCQELEERGRTGALDAAAERLARVRTEFETVEAALRSARSAMRSNP